MLLHYCHVDQHSVLPDVFLTEHKVLKLTALIGRRIQTFVTTRGKKNEDEHLFDNSSLLCRNHVSLFTPSGLYVFNVIGESERLKSERPTRPFL